MRGRTGRVQKSTDHALILELKIPVRTTEECIHLILANGLICGRPGKKVVGMVLGCFSLDKLVATTSL